MAIEDDIETSPPGGHHPILRLTLLIIGGLLGATAILALIIRQISFTSNPLMAVAAFTPYLMLAAAVAVALFAAIRAWIPSIIAVVVLALSVATQAHLYVAQTAPSDGVRLTVMTSNLRLGQAEPAAVVKLVRDHKVDLLSVQELTSPEVDRLRQAGLDTFLPYSELSPARSGAGVGVWSRYPLTDVTRPTGFLFRMVQAKIHVPGVGQPTTVVAAHMAGPWPDATHWAQDIARFRSTLKGFAVDNPNGAVIVGGDLNATPDTAQFRALLTDGYRDAADQAGAGMTRTYPADRWTGPLIAIDHVLTRNAVATKASTQTVADSDHRALLTTIDIPR